MLQGEKCACKAKPKCADSISLLIVSAHFARRQKMCLSSQNNLCEDKKSAYRLCANCGKAKSAVIGSAQVAAA